MRLRIRETIEVLVEEELEAALGAKSSQRSEVRRGYRHGVRARTLTTSLGRRRSRCRGRGGERRGRPHRVAQPAHRAVCAADRAGRRSAAGRVPVRDQYATGAGRAGAAATGRPAVEGRDLAPGGPVAGGLRDLGAAGSDRGEGRLPVFRCWYPRVRIGKKRVRVPVLVTLGTCDDGRRVVLDLRIAGEESHASWREVVDSLIARGVARPRLAVIDGNPGLTAALQAAWRRSTSSGVRTTSCGTCWPRHRPISRRTRRGLSTDDLRGRP